MVLFCYYLYDYIRALLLFSFVSKRTRTQITIACCLFKCLIFFIIIFFRVLHSRKSIASNQERSADKKKCVILWKTKEEKNKTLTTGCCLITSLYLVICKFDEGIVLFGQFCGQNGIILLTKVIFMIFDQTFAY